ncbi:MAG: TRAM domain-containing protein, partial [Planctomycetales bacterium]
MKRDRGRRALDILNEMRNADDFDLQLYDRDLPEFENQPVDQKLVLLAKHLSGKIITNDYNLNKVARVHGVAVINLNDLANALKTSHLVGDALDVQIIREGDQSGQGVGYLDDGTMVVVEGGHRQVGNRVPAVVTNVLQKAAGRMIFAKFSEQENGNSDEH